MNQTDKKRRQKTGERYEAFVARSFNDFFSVHAFFNESLDRWMFVFVLSSEDFLSVERGRESS